ncbi:hypothetical protein B7494_g4357 [Chlorociboria aeruginascens]|nr:hypothetical protein B7494_g4357 [Chlorociboria aeruginascens]
MATTYTNAALEVSFPQEQYVIHAAVQWRSNSPAKHGTLSYFQTVDILLQNVSTSAVEIPSNVHKVLLIQGHLKHEIAVAKSTTFLASAAQELVKKGSKEVALKLVLPVGGGFVVRADFLQQRLYGCPNIQWMEGFVAPRENLPIPSGLSTGLEHLAEILTAAAGGIVVDDKSELSLESLLSELETELLGRLSFPWLIPQPIPERKIAILGHRSLFMMERWFTAAHNMGIAVLVFGEHGSWLEDPQHSHLIEQFLPIDMSVNQDLPSRILEALQKSGHSINGITTTIDVYFDAAARVSQTLGLATSPVESLAISVDKYATRVLFGHDAKSYLISDVEDLRQQIDAGNAKFTYPQIVKPSKGWSSEGVFKVTNEKELFAAVEKLNSFSHGIKIIVETYADGPEVDANFLMWEGEILFFEVVDDFPSSADAEGYSESANFQELEMLYPSVLVESEKELLRTELHKFLLSSGFRSGIFHVEARVQNSTMEYTKVDGVTDLRLKAQPPTAKPNVFILEVNVRCPGWMVIWATAYTYGIDYAAFQMLCALGDGDRAKVLSQPFTFGAQASCESIFVPTPRGGTLAGDAICEEIARRRPDLMKNVVHYQTMAQPGETLPDPSSGTLTFVAAFNLATKESRTEMLRIGQTIRQEVRVDIR